MMHALIQVSKQWTARVVSLCVVGPICAMIAGGVVGIDGSRHTTFLSGSSISSGAIALAMVLGLTLVMGVVIGRVVDRREGFLNIAFVFVWIAWTSGRVGEIFRVAPESGTLIKLSIEGLMISGAVLIGMVLMTNPTKGTTHGHPDEVSRFDLGYIKSVLTKAEGLVSMLAALAGALVFSWLFGQTDLPGQSVGVGFGAGIVAGLVGALAANSARKEDHKSATTPFAPIFIGVMLASIMAPLIGMVLPGADGLGSAVIHSDLPGFLIVSPIAWTMGALMGVPMGHSWVEHSVHQAATTQAQTA